MNVNPRGTRQCIWSGEALVFAGSSIASASAAGGACLAHVAIALCEIPTHDLPQYLPSRQPIVNLKGAPKMVNFSKTRVVTFYFS